MPFVRAASMVLIISLLAGCSGVGALAPGFRALGAASVRRAMAGGNPCLAQNQPEPWSISVVNGIGPTGRSTPALLEFGGIVNGNTAPAQRIEGPATGFVSPAGLAYDANGFVYVADYGAGNVKAFDGVNGFGNLTPAVLSGPSGSFTRPMGIAIDATGVRVRAEHLYVEDPLQGVNYEFAYPGVIFPPSPPNAGPMTLLHAQGDLGKTALATVDFRGRVWVAATKTYFDGRPAQGVIYGIDRAATSPFITITSGVDGPVGVATSDEADASGVVHHLVYNTNINTNSITVHDQDTGALINTITSVALNQPTGIGVVPTGIIVANAGDNSILSFAPDASANAVPLGQLIGPDTHIHYPMGLYVNGNLVGFNPAPPTAHVSPATAVPQSRSEGPMAADAVGNYWIADQRANQIIRMTPGPPMSSTVYTIARPNTIVGQIAMGPDGSVWFTEEGGGLVRIDVANGAMHEFTLASGGHPLGIAAGPDGNMWFTEMDGFEIGKIAPVGGTPIEYTLTGGVKARFLVTAPGPNKVMFFSGTMPGGPLGSPSVAAVSVWDPVSHQVLQGGHNAMFPNSDLGRIAVGADCFVYVVDSATNSVAYMDVGFTGSGELHLAAGASPSSLTVGQDGCIWVTEVQTNRLARITPTNRNLTEFSVPNPGVPNGIAAGGDGKVYFTLQNGYVGTVAFQ